MTEKTLTSILRDLEMWLHLHDISTNVTLRLPNQHDGLALSTHLSKELGEDLVNKADCIRPEISWLTLHNVRIVWPMPSFHEKKEPKK